jgi:hypothetical protein
VHAKEGDGTARDGGPVFLADGNHFFRRRIAV